jgi:hypothetical protein
MNADENEVPRGHQSIRELSDAEVRRLADLRLDPAEQVRLSQLLDRQQADELTDPDRAELLVLMQVYEASLLQQAEALAEAVRRELRAPLSP